MIKILPKEIREKIAAGEVIEGPLSVIKELIENSIDSGASRITVEISDGGKALIQITDDGAGIAGDDLELAVTSFATSKIREFEDLNNIQTLGFRGEALASIAAVSILEIYTRTDSYENGSYIKVEGSKIIERSAKAFSGGTRVTVNDLFYNTPARLKFLKSSRSEVTKISDLIFKFALNYRNISFKFINTGREVFNILANSDINFLLKKVWNVSEKDVLEIKKTGPDYSVSGYISYPEFLRVNRNYQVFFLNDRLIKSPVISQALSNGFEGYSQINKHPVAVLFFNINPKIVDINAHPAKTEVRFQDTRELFLFISMSVKEELKKALLAKTQKTVNIFNTKTAPYMAYQNTAPVEAKLDLYFDKDDKDNFTNEGVFDNLQLRNNFIFDAYQYKNRYIITFIDDELVIIDQHALSEKINFEKFKSAFNKQLNTQHLLAPLMIELTYSQLEEYKELTSYFEKCGFIIESFEGNSITVRGIPSDIKTGRLSEMIISTIDELTAFESNNEKLINEKFIHSLACHSSVRSGDKLTREEMKYFIELLRQNPDYNFCPHGRPLFMKLDIKLLDKMFKRT